MFDFLRTRLLPTPAPLTRPERRRLAAAQEQASRRHRPDAREWFAMLSPQLYVVDPKSGERQRSEFRNVIENGAHR